MEQPFSMTVGYQYPIRREILHDPVSYPQVRLFHPMPYYMPLINTGQYGTISHTSRIDQRPFSASSIMLRYPTRFVNQVPIWSSHPHESYALVPIAPPWYPNTVHRLPIVPQARHQHCYTQTGEDHTHTYVVTGNTSSGYQYTANHLHEPRYCYISGEEDNHVHTHENYGDQDLPLDLSIKKTTERSTTTGTLGCESLSDNECQNSDTGREHLNHSADQDVERPLCLTVRTQHREAPQDLQRSDHETEKQILTQTPRDVELNKELKKLHNSSSVFENVGWPIDLSCSLQPGRSDVIRSDPRSDSAVARDNRNEYVSVANVYEIHHEINGKQSATNTNNTLRVTSEQYGFCGDNTVANHREDHSSTEQTTSNENGMSRTPGEDQADRLENKPIDTKNEQAITSTHEIVLHGGVRIAGHNLYDLSDDGFLRHVKHKRSRSAAIDESRYDDGTSNGKKQCFGLVQYIGNITLTDADRPIDEESTRVNIESGGVLQNLKGRIVSGIVSSERAQHESTLNTQAKHSIQTIAHVPLDHLRRSTTVVPPMIYVNKNGTLRIMTGSTALSIDAGRLQCAEALTSSTRTAADVADDCVPSDVAAYRSEISHTDESVEKHDDDTGGNCHRSPGLRELPYKRITTMNTKQHRKLHVDQLYSQWMVDNYRYDDPETVPTFRPPTVLSINRTRRRFLTRSIASFQPLSKKVSSLDALRQYVYSKQETWLSLSWPGRYGVWIDRKYLPDDPELAEIMRRYPISEWMFPVGHVMDRSKTVMLSRETPFMMVCSNKWVVVCKRDTIGMEMYYAASSISDLMIEGMTHVDCIYKDESVPYGVRMDYRLEKLSGILNVEALQEYVNEILNGTQWAFNGMPGRLADRVLTFCTVKWGRLPRIYEIEHDGKPLIFCAMISTFPEDAPDKCNLMIAVDDSLRVYGYDPASKQTFKLADNIKMFLKIGTRRAYACYEILPKDTVIDDYDAYLSKFPDKYRLMTGFVP